MFKYALLFFLIAGLVRAAPEPKTPASTEKLTPLIAPLPALALSSGIAAVPIAAFPIAYAYPAPFKIATVPYTIEQHSFTIEYHK